LFQFQTFASLMSDDESVCVMKLCMQWGNYKNLT